MKKLLIAILALSCVALVIVVERHWLFYQVGKIAQGSPPPLLDATTELPATIWFDDYYTVDEVAPGTFAIGEPRYYQQNFNYLVVGAHTALLFDAGPGIRDIRPVIESLTTLPIIFLPSHFHYDHVGNGRSFAQRAVVDLPYLRERASGNALTFTDMEHLGPVEGFAIPTWNVDHWWAPGHVVDLGGRAIQVIHTPGHSPESISVLDIQNQVILSGDYLYKGSLFAFVPGSSLRDYLASAEHLFANHGTVDAYYGAHRSQPPGPPRLHRKDVADLRDALKNIQSGQAANEGFWPTVYPVNDQITLYAEPGFLQDWD